MLYTSKEILFCKERFNILYGTSFRGLELIIFLRAIGIFRKPIIIWHHTAITKSPNFFRELISTFFYKGIDKMFLFSQKLISKSLEANKTDASKLKLIHWGADLSFYDHLLSEYYNVTRKGFISTGKENRDLKTLIYAFFQKNKEQELDIYSTFLWKD